MGCKVWVCTQQILYSRTPNGRLRLWQNATNHQVVATQPIGFSKAAVQACGLRNQTEKLEIRKIYIEPGAGMTGEKPVAKQMMFACVACNLFPQALDAEARMGEGIALAGLSRQERCARICLERLGVG